MNQTLKWGQNVTKHFDVTYNHMFYFVAEAVGGDLATATHGVLGEAFFQKRFDFVMGRVTAPKRRAVGVAEARAPGPAAWEGGVQSGGRGAVAGEVDFPVARKDDVGREVRR